MLNRLILAVFLVAFAGLAAAKDPMGQPPGMPATLAKAFDNLPRHTLDPLSVVKRNANGSDEIMVTRQVGEETYVVSTTTVAKLLSQAKDDTVNPIPPNPQPGDEITVTQTRVFGNQRWRYSYTYTWQLNPTTGQMEWFLTGSTTKFLGYVNNSEK